MRAFSAVLTGAVLMVGLPACAGDGASTQTTTAESVQLTTVTEGLEHPWGLAFLPDGDALVTERPGRLSRVNMATGQRTVIQGVPAVAARGQGGMLDVALHPRFADNGRVYLSYSEPGNDGSLTAVGRGVLRDDRLESFEVIFRATPPTDRAKHFGSRLIFDDQGYLFITSGERGARDNAQRLESHHGKIIRLHDDGRVPEDNPFLSRQGAHPGIYSYGHRNPQGAIFHPPTGQLWVNEHGPQGGDEVNIVKPGANYGWPLTTYGEEYGGGYIGPGTMEGIEPPIHHWTPSIAPSGMLYYDGDAFPQWRGNIFVGALAHAHLSRLVLDGETVVEEEKLLEEQGWRIRAVDQGPEGHIYVLVDSDDAPLVRISPAR
ncbi:PQQ-dependent sugar dehydrogenase [Ectothiorhodospiraceae bacterium WFHF3C12]|nr:PQQ-dependent sugar dehydrogenase [Ectothiorhodospiraceae bacterium WFHF3C12]